MNKKGIDHLEEEQIQGATMRTAQHLSAITQTRLASMALKLGEGRGKQRLKKLSVSEG